jgi:hypothetical protein
MMVMVMVDGGRGSTGRLRIELMAVVGFCVVWAAARLLFSLSIFGLIGVSFCRCGKPIKTKVSILSVQVAYRQTDRQTGSPYDTCSLRYLVAYRTHR